MSDWQELESRYFLSTYKRLPVTLVRGQGVRVWDDQGKEYLDFIAGIATVSLGHCHPVVVSALAEQASTLMHVSGLVYSVPQLRLAQLLVENSCLDRAFFANSGGEVVEGAIKLARKWGKEKKDGAYVIICAQNAFHGRTLATLTAGGTERYKLPYLPLPEGFVHVPFDDAEAIRRATDAKTVAVMLEPVQGEAGVVVPHDDYLRQVRGRGLLWAIELDGELAEAATRACLEEGLILNNVKPTALRLMPPLIVSEEELDRAVEIIDGVLGKLEGERA